MPEPVQERRGEVVLEVTDLEKSFPVRQGIFSGGGLVRAVAGITFSLHRGETLGVVGESGCGKTTLGKTVMRLLTPDAGRIRLKGRDITSARDAVLRQGRRDMQMVFQDPFSSLDPRMSCGRIVSEPLEIHGLVTAADRRAKVEEMFAQVGLRADQIDRYPHQLSGGQRQRLGLARALALEPAVIVADEPVSALDVSVQAQVLNLMMALQRRKQLAYLFISHDLAVVEHISDQVAVMYLGRIVEIAPKRTLFANPRHPYTEALLSAVPRPRPDTGRARAILTGDVPSPVNPPAGCAFHPRCPIATEICRSEIPTLAPLANGQRVACHLRAPAGLPADAPA
ncbi:MAG: dipeptide ABC transporter ATP-binding protein [Pseudomonadota bacterium]